MNSGAILALIGDLYAQVARLQEENDQLRSQLGANGRPSADERPATPPGEPVDTP